MLLGEIANLGADSTTFFASGVADYNKNKARTLGWGGKIIARKLLSGKWDLLPLKKGESMKAGYVDQVTNPRAFMEAVANFQEERKLKPVDGKLGPGTWAAIKEYYVTQADTPKKKEEIAKQQEQQQQQQQQQQEQQQQQQEQQQQQQQSAEGESFFSKIPIWGWVAGGVVLIGGIAVIALGGSPKPAASVAGLGILDEEVIRYLKKKRGMGHPTGRCKALRGLGCGCGTR